MADIQALSNQILGIGMGIGQSTVRALQRRVANLTAFADVSNRVTSAQDVIYDIFEGDNEYSAGKIDTTKTRLNQAITLGITDLTSKVESTVGFKVGQEITIQDDVNKENVIVTRADETLPGTIDKTTPVSVVASAHATSPTARPQMLSNGWIVTCVNDSVGTKLKFYVSKDNGSTFQDLCFINATVSNGFTITSYGTNVYALLSAGTTVYSVKIDVLTQTNVTIDALLKNVDVSQSSFGSGCSIAVSTTGVLTATWSSKNATYPNSFNIRSAKSTDGGTTWTKQDGTAGVDQITTYNTAGQDQINPYVIDDKNNVPIIFAQLYNGSNYFIANFRFTTSWQTLTTVYSTPTYVQSNPTATLDKNGRIHATWQGKDATDGSYFNIKYCYSDDNGATWSAVQKLTSGNTYQQINPSITTDKNGNVYIVWSGLSAISTVNYRIKTLSWNGVSWSAITDLTTNTTADMLNASTCDNYKDFENPITIWKDSVATRVAFYGKFQANVYTPYLQVTALVNAYKKFARVYRSLPDVDTVNKRLKFSSGFDGETIYDRTTPVSVVGSAYTTSATARPQVLSNGWIVTCVFNVSTDIRFYVSKDNGATFSLLTTWSATATAGFAMCSYNNTIHAIATNSAGTTCQYLKFDSTTVGTTIATTSSIDLTQSSFGSGCSIAASSTGILTAAWSSKFSSYPNSFNIRSAKSVDGGTTWTKQDGSAGIEQVTNYNTVGQNITAPYVIYNKNNTPLILWTYSETSSNGIGWTTNGTPAGTNINGLYFGGTYVQANPTATLDKNGRIHVAWYGKDVTDSARFNIRYSYSDDNGVTWSSMSKRTNGNTYDMNYPSITSDTNGNVYIFYNSYSASTVSNISYIVYTSSWSAPTVLTTNTTNDDIYPSCCDNYKDFVNPLTIWKDAQNTKILFYGKFSVGTKVPLLSEDIRYNITPKTGTAYQVISWIERETDAGLSVDSKLSIVGSGANENFVSMTKTNTVDASGKTEDEFVGNGTVNSKVTHRMTMTRNINSLDKAITKVLGGIA